jgi:hypothetical protein
MDASPDARIDDIPCFDGGGKFFVPDYCTMFCGKSEENRGHHAKNCVARKVGCGQQWSD